MLEIDMFIICDMCRNLIIKNVRLKEERRLFNCSVCKIQLISSI